MLALGETNKNNTALSKSLKKVSSGMRLKSAGDGASDYAISEKMRVMIRSLNQDEENVKKGINLINTAEGGIQNIVTSLRSLKALALNSANDHNSDIDRKILQKSFSSYIDNIDDIASTTNYDNKYLLNGNYRRGSNLSSQESVSSETEDLNKISDFVLPNELLSYTAFKSYIESEINRQDLPVTGCTTDVRPSGTANYIQYGNTIEITSDGIFQLPNLGCNILIKAQNVEIQGNGNICRDFFIKTYNDNSKIWLNNVNIVNDFDIERSIITFTGKGNSLNLIGKNTLESTVIKYIHRAVNFTCDPIPIIDVGDELTVNNGVKTQEGVLYIPDSTVSTAHCGIGTAKNKNANIIINSGTMGICSTGGAAIGSPGARDKYDRFVGDITINGGYILAFSYGGTAIGAGCSGNDYDHEEYARYNKLVPTFVNTGAGNIFIGANAKIDVYSAGSAAIGASSYQKNHHEGTAVGSTTSSVGNITIESNNVRAYAPNDEAIGSGHARGWNQQARTTIFYNEYNASVGEIKSDKNSYLLPFQDDDLKTRYHLYSSKNSSSEDDIDNINNKGDSPLIIHFGPKANQNLHVYINNMHSSAIGLDDTGVDPREKALESLEKIDNAIDYALNEIVRMGAYQSRLGFTLENITTANENTMSAESVIRDTDMAKEMTQYTKESILSQTAQTILTQANKKSSDVLSLLES